MEKQREAKARKKKKKGSGFSGAFLKAAEGLGSFCIDKRIYFLVFFLSSLIMFLSYAFFKIFPIGENSVLVLDLNGQYVYYYERYRDVFWGHGSWLYSWSRNLSGEMFGVFAYYLASPYMLIIALLPRSMMPTSILILQLAKIGSSAVTCSFFLKKWTILNTGKPPKNVSLVVFPLLYSLMGYMVVQLMDPMWLDGLVLLPLICWGVHRLVEEGKMLPYIIPLTLMFISHFYIGYMVGIFTFFYFCYACLYRSGRVFPKKLFARCVSFGVGTLTALLCASFVLIPVYNSLKLGKFEFTDPDFSLATQFDFLTFITKLFPMTYDTVYPEGMPMIYCGCAVLLLLPLYFMNDRVQMKEKTGTGILAVILVILMYIKPADMAMHGFQVPNWLPFRYSFIFSFLLIFMAFRAFENLDGITAKNIGGVFFGLMVFLFWCERENYAHFQLFTTRTNEKTGELYNVIQGIWLSMIALAVYFLMIYLSKKYRSSKAVAICLCVIVSAELFVNNIDTIQKIDDDVAYSKYSSYEPYMSDLRAAVDMIKEYDDETFYRMEATFHRTVNDAIGTGYMSVSHSSSTMNAPALLMLHRLGYAYGGHYTKYDGTTFITDAVFDIKYVMDKIGDKSYVSTRIKVPEEYKLTTELTRNSKKVNQNGDFYTNTTTFKFYNNPYHLGLGVVSRGDIASVELDDDNPFENQNRLFNALYGEELDLFSPANVVNTDMENVTAVPLTDGHVKYYQSDPGTAECHVDYVVRMPRDSYLYMYLPTKYERSCNIWIQNEDEYVDGANNMAYAGQFFVGDNYSILNLGKFYQDQEIRVRVTIANEDNEAYWRDRLFYTFDYDRFTAAAEDLKQDSFEITHFEDTRVEGKATAKKDGDLLFTTIPYENGWTITVNGREVKPVKTLDSLIAIPLEAGDNNIKMNFSPNYWRLSLITTMLGILLLLVIFLFEFRRGKYIKKLIRAVGGKEAEQEAADSAKPDPVPYDPPAPVIPDTAAPLQTPPENDSIIPENTDKNG
ncbi:MAG: YfhO family protein [Ruminococcus sp.]|nr:YfhO family protein [Ruminococcus sp.]